MRGVMAHIAGIVYRAVGQGMKIRGGPVQPSICMRYCNDGVTVVTGWFVTEPVVNLVTGHTDYLFG